MHQFVWYVLGIAGVNRLDEVNVPDTSLNPVVMASHQSLRSNLPPGALFCQYALIPKGKTSMLVNFTVGDGMSGDSPLHCECSVHAPLHGGHLFAVCVVAT